jgi:ribose transport system substrate-binding protein
MQKLNKPLGVCVSTLAIVGLAVGVAGAHSVHAKKHKKISTAAGIAYAKGQVKKYSHPTGVPKAGPKIKGGIKSLQGKTIFIIPQSTTIPYQAAVVQGMQSAAAAAGLQVQVCNGASTPSTESGCLQQAITSGAAGVASDGIEVGQVPQSIDALESAHIPFVQGGLTQAKGNDKVAYAWNDSFLQSRLAADAIIADSKGKANILIVRHTDSPATEQFMDQGGAAQIKKYCPKCHTTTIDTNAVELSQLTGQVSAALEANPNINYILAEFDFDVQSVSASLQSLDKQIPIISTTALLPGLENIENGNYEVADAGTDPAYAGWAIIDQLLRMMTGTKPNTKVPMPVRVFTKSNVSSLSLTSTDFTNGSWYGATGFQQMFLRLWGVSS